MSWLELAGQFEQRQTQILQEPEADCGHVMSCRPVADRSVSPNQSV